MARHEELANDEHVRRLYLGTNFELRRKDWIIDMERDNALQKAAENHCSF